MYFFIIQVSSSNYEKTTVDNFMKEYLALQKPTGYILVRFKQK